MRRSGTNYPCSLQGVQINLLTSTSKPPRPAAFHADQELEGRHIRHAVLSCTGSGLGSERAFKMSSALIAVISLSSCTEINMKQLFSKQWHVFPKEYVHNPAVQFSKIKQLHALVTTVLDADF